jgi:FMN phosphatase YigB (HAD superfamily)
MAVRLVAFDLDGTLIRGPNALAVIGAALRRPEWDAGTRHYPDGNIAAVARAILEL